MEESEDERIRKALMQNLKERFGTKGNMGKGLDMPDVLAWLEKKGEQKPVPKFKIGDTMRTLQEAKDGWTDGMPFVVSIDSEYYNCNSEKIAIKDQDKYEYPPMNRKHDVCDTCNEKASCVNPCPVKLVEQKPAWSEEQMEELRKHSDNVILRNLYYNLKKLREE